MELAQVEKKTKNGDEIVVYSEPIEFVWHDDTTEPVIAVISVKNGSSKIVECYSINDNEYYDAGDQTEISSDTTVFYSLDDAFEEIKKMEGGI